MQIFGPGLSGLTSVSLTKEGARKQRGSDTGRVRCGERGRRVLWFSMWSPVGKPLASVYNAQTPSRRKQMQMMLRLTVCVCVPRCFLLITWSVNQSLPPSPPTAQY